MALWDFLKRKKEIEKTKKPTEKIVEKPSAAKKTEEPVRVSPRVGRRKSLNFSYEVIKEPHISEKATMLGETVNQYTFKIFERAKKAEIKKAIEGIYGVDVLSVNVIRIPKKKRRIGRSEGFKKGYRKAVVTVGEGQKIEMF